MRGQLNIPHDSEKRYTEKNQIVADLSSAKVENDRFGYNSSIPDSLKSDLIQRRALFEDSPSDRSQVLAPF